MDYDTFYGILRAKVRRRPWEGQLAVDQRPQYITISKVNDLIKISEADICTGESIVLKTELVEKSDCSEGSLAT